MLDVRTDAPRKRIYLTFRGAIDIQAVSEGASRMLAAACALGPGFDLVHDISLQKSSDDLTTAVIARTQGQLLRLGPRRIVRVVGQRGAAALQLRRPRREFGATHRIAVVATLAEADALLARP
ncbi:MAG TPA: hypothetical protein VHW23_47390 [Kofleriaceae bacterium]|jgi:hypothetical protein|nr:hypothetical protein [Kofleriaceae bacterium]